MAELFLAAGNEVHNLRPEEERLLCGSNESIRGSMSKFRMSQKKGIEENWLSG